MLTQVNEAKELIESQPVIPYADVDQAPESMRAMLAKYAKRMGFLPNALRFYLHRPEIAEPLWRLNDAVLRDSSSSLDQMLKRKLAAHASKINGCKYGVTHHCTILKSPGGFGAEGWHMSESELQKLLHSDLEPENEFEAVCFEFVGAASADPTAVPPELLKKLVGILSPPQVVELAALIGFWKMYNTIHDCLSIPIEQALLNQSTEVGL